MTEFEQNRGVQLGNILLEKLQDIFTAIAVSDTDTLATIRKVFRENQYILCPHSAMYIFIILIHFFFNSKFHH